MNHHSTKLTLHTTWKILNARPKFLTKKKISCLRIFQVFFSNTIYTERNADQYRYIQFSYVIHKQINLILMKKKTSKGRYLSNVEFILLFSVLFDSSLWLTFQSFHYRFLITITLSALWMIGYSFRSENTFENCHYIKLIWYVI